MSLSPAAPQAASQLAACPDQNKGFLKVAILTLVIYASLAVFYSTPALSTSRFNKELVVWPVTLGLLWSYWQGYKRLQKNAVPPGWILGVGAGLAILAVLIPPFHSTDMFGYVNRGWQQLHYHLNPYVYTINDIPHWENDPMITNHWVNNPSPYGFLYLLIAKGLCLLGGGNRALTLSLFKLGNLLMHGLTALLIWLGASQLAKTQAQQPLAPSTPMPVTAGPVLALYLYLWNPLILINTLANGHNDIFMGFFVTLSALCALIGAWLWILPALMAATLMKYGAVVIFPLALVFLIRQKAWGALIGGIGLSVILFLLAGQSFLPEWQQFHLSEINHNAFVTHGSLHSFLFIGFKTITKSLLPAAKPYLELVRSILKNLLLLSYGGFVLGLLWQRLRSHTPYPAGTLVRDALLVMSLLVSLISLKFYPWYLGMFFPLALLLPEEDWLRRWVLVLSGAQLFSITFIGQAHMLNFMVMTGLPTAWILWHQQRERELSAIAPENTPPSHSPLPNAFPEAEH